MPWRLWRSTWILCDIFSSKLSAATGKRIRTTMLTTLLMCYSVCIFCWTAKGRWALSTISLSWRYRYVSHTFLLVFSRGRCMIYVLLTPYSSICIIIAFGFFVQVVSWLIAAILHDYAHPGVNNAYLVRSVYRLIPFRPCYQSRNAGSTARTLKRSLSDHFTSSRGHILWMANLFLGSLQHSCGGAL